MDQLLLRRTASVPLATAFLGAVTTAGVPPPYLHMSFDRGLATDGTGRLKLQIQSGKKAGAVRFVPGVSGRGVVLGERLVLQADGLVPAPEGSRSISFKPLDWRRKKRVPYFLRTFVSDGTASTECMLYQYIRRTSWYEGWRRGVKKLRMPDLHRIPRTVRILICDRCRPELRFAGKRAMCSHVSHSLSIVTVARQVLTVGRLSRALFPQDTAGRPRELAASYAAFPEYHFSSPPRNSRHCTPRRLRTLPADIRASSPVVCPISLGTTFPIP